MIKQEISRADAIRLINSGKTVKNDTSDGYCSIRMKRTGFYQIKIYTTGDANPVSYEGNLVNLMKTMNKFNEGWYYESKEGVR